MSEKSEIINVEVSRRILWIGGEAYPLQNIARVQMVKLEPNREAVIRNYVKSILLWILSGAIASSVLGGAGSSAAIPLAVVAVLAVIAFKTRQMAKILSQRYFALNVETAGSPRTALVSSDEEMVTKLVHQITDAINDPQAEFQYKIENIHVGDKIQQFGDRNVGKVSK